MKLLSRIEEIILMAVWSLQGNAYGVTIREHVSKVSGKEWTFGAIYVPLDKLTQKEFLRKFSSEPTANRGGRHKCLYEITPEGKEALRQIREVTNAVWNDAPDFGFERS